MPKDPYIIDNVGTLRNKLGITDYEELKEAEKSITFAKFLNIDRTFHTKFDANYLKSIHKHIFEDIFDWAGEFRSIPFIKEELVLGGHSLEYPVPKQVPKELVSCLKKMNSTDWSSLNLEQKVVTFTEQLAQLWKIHPFRDGNTRTTVTFAKQFAKEHGFPLDFAFLLDNLSRKEDANGKIIQHSIRDKLVLAALPSEYAPEPKHLQILIRKAMISGISQNITNLQNQLDDTTR